MSSEIVSLFISLYSHVLFLSISTFTSLFFKLFKFLNTPLKLFLFLPCFLTYFFNLYHHNQLAFSSNQTLDTALLPPPHLLGEFQVVPLLSLSPLTKWFRTKYSMKWFLRSQTYFLQLKIEIFKTVN